MKKILGYISYYFLFKEKIEILNIWEIRFKRLYFLELEVLKK